MEKTFRALIVTDNKEKVSVEVVDCSTDQLSEGDTLIDVYYSAVNYKDALALQKNGGVIRHYPMIPGIDAVGIIKQTKANQMRVGDRVVVTGRGTGVTHTGGFSEVLRVPSDWVQVLPQQINLKKAALIGTAGITALRAIEQLELIGLGKDKKVPILVTGASGGVGSLAILLLNKLGFTNITGVSRKGATDYILNLGASEVLPLSGFKEDKVKPLQSITYKYVIDTIGGSSLSSILPKIAYNGGMSLCGNASGISFTTTVLPFILRGVSIFGIDSVQLTHQEKYQMWSRLNDLLSDDDLEKISGNIGKLEDINQIASKLLAGEHVGRSVIEIRSPQE
ncbi:YhdH/YhfP family quinone oxidoreductase [Vagococcus jeotgali]|uniref:YhdH/YhfP family quinone oxidoreductase n=1 Tax=Vagococcus jeotgali TaxID=3109030 RepID=UPI002DD88E8A|nr:YhdH/YhfP family quinone oxidoreductase [Vagococcus sp. B2T-5]